MGAAETTAALAGFERRGAGSDAERRAALWLAGELRTAQRDATIETFWCRPNWALAHCWHVALGLAGSLVSIGSPKVGGALILLALVSLVADGLAGRSLGRRLTPERASQNVISRRPRGADPHSPAGLDPQPPAGLDPHPASPGPARQTKPTTLIITANYDAGRAGLVYRTPIRRLAARLRRALGSVGPGWLGWIAIAMAWLVVTALLRSRGADGTEIGAAQLIPTVALVLTLALLLELASSGFGPAAGDNASGVAVAIALARALDVAPPRHLDVEVVLQGAGDGAMIGLRRHLRARRRELTAPTSIVLGIGACGAGSPVWWTSDGSLVALRYLPRLGEIADRVAGPASELSAHPHRGRGITPALPARIAGLPALTIGCLDGLGLVPRSHQLGDVAEALERASIDRLLALALTLVDGIDADLRRAATGRSGAARAAV